ncbi:MAG: hypothetical protein ACI9NY_000046 [Kiritimatiellia bacterium]|jgi:hypothetical protein
MLHSRGYLRQLLLRCSTTPHPCGYIGSEPNVTFARCINNSPRGAYFWYAYFRDPTTVSRIIYMVNYIGLYALINHLSLTPMMRYIT